MKQCEICGSSDRVKGKTGKFKANLCNKHYAQMRLYGHILDRTISSPNEFVVNGDVVEIVLYNRKHIEVGRALVDIQFLETITKYKWYLDKCGYVTSKGKNSVVLLHRLVTSAQDGFIVDHIDHNTLNNSLSNLRLCSNRQNSFNHVVSSNNTSGVPGVSWHSRCNKWQAYITCGEFISLGYYADKQDAINARLAAVEKYFGEFAYNPSISTPSDATK